ncbi:PASTA domain-containing protein [Halocola ammonii]
MKIIRFIFSKVFLKNLLFAIVFVAVVVLGANLYLNSYTDHGESVEVPDLRGMKIEDIEGALANTTLNYEIIDSVYNEGARGTVLEQLPPPSAQVKEDRSIYLTVNAMRQPMKELKVKIGESFRIAQTKLNIDGIEYTTEYKPGVCNNCVLGMKYEGKEVETGTKIRRGDKITLVLGERGNQKVSVPRLFGLSLDSAEKVLADNSLTLGFPFFDQDIETKEDSLNAKIYDQHPEGSGDEELRIGSPVDVWLTTKSLDSDSLSSQGQMGMPDDEANTTTP